MELHAWMKEFFLSSSFSPYNPLSHHHRFTLILISLSPDLLISVSRRRRPRRRSGGRARARRAGRCTDQVNNVARWCACVGRGRGGYRPVRCCFLLQRTLSPLSVLNSHCCNQHHHQYIIELRPLFAQSTRPASSSSRRPRGVGRRTRATTGECAAEAEFLLVRIRRSVASKRGLVP